MVGANDALADQKIVSAEEAEAEEFNADHNASGDVPRQPPRQRTRSEALYREREKLALESNGLIEQFNGRWHESRYRQPLSHTGELATRQADWRGWTRNALWMSLVLLLLTCVMNDRFGLHVRAVLVGGMILVPVTLYKSRTASWPVLATYRANHARGVQSSANKSREKWCSWGARSTCDDDPCHLGGLIQLDLKATAIPALVGDV